ncbi:Uncharacterised protein [Mycobacteroides abscessus subsp. abscessus]|nr:Uncharacterised protein [Mycobacteroides abscessus subsp. abscessus]
MVHPPLSTHLPRRPLAHQGFLVGTATDLLDAIGTGVHLLAGNQRNVTSGDARGFGDRALACGRRRQHQHGHNRCQRLHFTWIFWPCSGWSVTRGLSHGWWRRSMVPGSSHGRPGTCAPAAARD